MAMHALRLCAQTSRPLLRAGCFSRARVGGIAGHRCLQSTTPSGDSAPLEAVPVAEAAPIVAKQNALQHWGGIYFELGKGRLSALVACTGATGFVLGSAGMPMDWGNFGVLLAGTYLSACAANGINQWREIHNDSLMERTANRPLPSGRITPNHALTAALVAATSGAGLLAVQINPLCAGLCVLNLGIYTMIYTPMKQTSHLNTWAGAVVGAIPPLMGWAAATGSLPPAAFPLAALLFSWQLPHFMALAHMLRSDYLAGGYQMLPSFDTPKTANVILRNSLYLFPIAASFPLLGVCSWPFAAEASALSMGFVYLAIRFRNSHKDEDAKKVFLFSLMYLPAVMAAMMFHRTSTEEAVHVPCPHEAIQVEHIGKNKAQ